MSDSEVVWNIRYTETAKNDLKGIVSYIKNVLLEEMIAQNMYSAITSAIRSLDTMPFRHQLYPDEPWFSQGLTGTERSITEFSRITPICQVVSHRTSILRSRSRRSLSRKQEPISTVLHPVPLLFPSHIIKPSSQVFTISISFARLYKNVPGSASVSTLTDCH